MPRKPRKVAGGDEEGAMSGAEPSSSHGPARERPGGGGGGGRGGGGRGRGGRGPGDGSSGQPRNFSVGAGPPARPQVPGSFEGGGERISGTSAPPSSRLLPVAPVPVSIAQGGSRGQDERVQQSNVQASQPTQFDVGSATSELAAQFQSQLHVQPAGPVVSVKHMQSPCRPGLGKLGRKFELRVNHFLVKLRMDKDLHQYRVDITPELVSRGLNRAVIRELVKNTSAADLGNTRPVFDGRNFLFTAGKLPFEIKEFSVALEDEQRVAVRRARVFKVTIKFAAKVDLHHLSSFLEGKQRDVPQETLQALDIVLREVPSGRYTTIGRSFYSNVLGEQVLGGGLVGWRGFFQSVRPTQMGLSLNLNITATAVLQPSTVLEFLDRQFKDLRLGNYNRGFNLAQRKEVLKALKGAKIEVTHRGEMRRKYRVGGLTKEPTRSLTFPMDDGKFTTVTAYFQGTYNYRIQYPELPCFVVGNPKKPSYLPMEVCKIMPGQRYAARQLREEARTNLLRMTSQAPFKREQEILQTLQQNAYSRDEYAQEFGIQVAENETKLEARLLDAPYLVYKSGRPGGAGSKLEVMQVYMGAWNMMQGKQFVRGGTVKSWACVSFNGNVPHDVAQQFCKNLARKCSDLGMTYSAEPAVPIDLLQQNAESLKGFLSKCPGGGTDLGLLIAILPDVKSDWYGELKRVCETEVGVVSQCCWSKHVFQMKDQYLANVAMKINMKAGGKNTVLRDAMSLTLPTLGRDSTVIFGADVSHASPGEDVPSIAAVVASQDWPEISNYSGLVSAQRGRVEQIHDLGKMVKSLLISYYQNTGMKPARILFYRDGVSEGEFNVVLLNEVNAIREACTGLEPRYEPKITFVVVQKRHHTRFFPVDQKFADKNGNVLPGTVVDTKICHPSEFDFYLCSHAGLLGTSRPAHYHVLWDENNFTSDSLQSLTNNLCSTYARCCKSVSIVPPAYYAHHLATRGRWYMGGGDTLPLPVNNIKNSMFYC